jgi:hypothetical protein
VTVKNKICEAVLEESTTINKKFIEDQFKKVIEDNKDDLKNLSNFLKHPYISSKHDDYENKFKESSKKIFETAKILLNEAANIVEMIKYLNFLKDSPIFIRVFIPDYYEIDKHLECSKNIRKTYGK